MARELKNLLVYRLHDRALLEMAGQHLKGRLIDIGCGDKPYEDLLKPLVAEHVGVDHAATPHGTARVDLIASAYDIPVPEASFDSALSTAGLEHLEEPGRALDECFRVLKPGAVALYSAPFIWHLHEEPRDFFRFSKYGLAYLFEKAGFEVLEVRALSGFWVTFGVLLCYQLERFSRGPLRWFKVIDALGLGIQGLAYLLDRVDRREGWTWMYMVAARKPARPSV